MGQGLVRSPEKSSGMKTVEAFLQEYWAERLRMDQARTSILCEFQATYFTTEFNAGRDAKKSLGTRECEQILDVSEQQGHTVVITGGFGHGRVKYTLSQMGDSWLVGEIGLECGLCKGTGKQKKYACFACEGRGWQALLDS